MAFRWDARGRHGRLVPIAEPALFDLDDLLGVERSVERLVANTEQFVRGHPSNHVLLYGERGTGKSSAVRGLLSRFAGDGLRVVEVRKHDLIHLPLVLELLRDAPYRFLLFCDDLSFDAGEPGMRDLKAALEGSFEAPSPNVRVVATSNRRHLLPETLADNAGWEGPVVLRQVRKASGSNGFDALDGKTKDLFEAGIVDPTKVVRSALQNASSVAALLLSTDALIANLPEDAKEAPAGGEDEDY